MRDYSERRQSRTAAVVPPKRPSVWPSILLVLFLMIVAFAAGLGSGWYLYRPGGKFYIAPKMQQPTVQPKAATTLPPQGDPVAPQNPSNAPPNSEKGPGAAPLTFYNTLQKGNKELMGTGINQPKGASQSPPRPATPPVPER